MIKNEIEVCQTLSIPSIPKKQWDSKTHFKRGVGIVELLSGLESYVVVKYDDDDAAPVVIKSFKNEPFVKLKTIFVIPQYMETIDIEKADLDEESKSKIKLLEDEAKELEMKDVEEKIELPQNEYFFNNIKNDDEAKAFIRAYNKKNKLNAKVPKSHQEIVMRLSVIWSEQNNIK